MNDVLNQSAAYPCIRARKMTGSRSAISCRNGDAAGQQGTAAIRNLLAPQMPVAVVLLQEREQPDQLMAREIQRLVQQSQAEAGDERMLASSKEND